MYPWLYAYPRLRTPVLEEEAEHKLKNRKWVHEAWKKRGCEGECCSVQSSLMMEHNFSKYVHCLDCCPYTLTMIMQNRMSRNQIKK